MRVRLYRNLKIRDQRAWSLMAMEGARKGKVIDIVDGAVLEDVSFVVSEPGRQRVIRDRAKNVHAFVDGELIKSSPLYSGKASKAGTPVRITYDPYTMKQFVRIDCMQPVREAGLVAATPDGVFAKLPRCAGKSLRGVIVVGVGVPTADDWNG
jgi:hypothetical protein